MRRCVALLLLVPLLAHGDDAPKLAKVAELEWARDSSVRSFLADDEAPVRRAAARALGRIAAPGDEIALAESASIAKLLLDRLPAEKDPDARRELIHALGQAGTPEAARALVKLRDEGSEPLFASRALRLAAQESDRGAIIRGLSMSFEIAEESALTIGILERRLRAAGNATIDTATRAAVLPLVSKWLPDKAYGAVFALSAMADPREDARAALERALVKASDRDTAAEAARGLARSARDQSPPEAIFADYPDACVAVEVVHALTKHKRSPRARTRLLQLLGHSSFHARREAALALADATPEANAAEISGLERALDNPYATVRASALLALATRAPEKALAAAKRFRERDAAARMAASRALAALIPHAREEATRIVKELASSDPDHRVRMTALDALGEHGDDTTVLALASDRVRNDDDPGIFETAVDLLVKKGGTETESLLVAGYTRTRDRHEFFEAREQIVTSLAALGARLGEGGRKLIELATSDPDASVAAAATKAWAELTGAKVDGDRTKPPRPRKKLAVSPRDFGEKQPILTISTSRGSFEVELFPAVAPLHVANVVTLAEKHFYDKLSWHRVVSNFVIQGGCPRGDGSGDPGYTIPDELSLEPYTRGTLGMPKTATKDTGGCQLFFTHGRTPHLEGRYSVFGRVRKGLEVIDLIEEGDTIESVKVELESRSR